MLMVGRANIVTNAQNIWSPFSSPKPTNSKRSILFVRSGVHPVIIAANCERLDAAVQLQRLVRRHALVTAHSGHNGAKMEFFFLSLSLFSGAFLLDLLAISWVPDGRFRSNCFGPIASTHWYRREGNERGTKSSARATDNPLSLSLRLLDSQRRI